MTENKSPWIHQLERKRPLKSIDKDLDTDVVVVGGGIAGLTTAYFILKNTGKRVVLLEAGKVAHGATGHNAGQLTSYFERSFTSLVEEFGLEMAGRAQRGVESSWEFIDQIKKEINLKSPYAKFIGHAGCSTVEQLISHLTDNYYRRKTGLPIEMIFVAQEAGLVEQIPDVFEDLYLEMPHQHMLDILQTDNKDYIGLISYWKGCMNSAAFTEELAEYLTSKYADRFLLCEESPVKIILAYRSKVSMTALNHSVIAEKVVLCTNGFENFDIINEAGPEINSKFHHLVRGKVGYMVGYIDSSKRAPTAISYLVKPPADQKDFDPTGESYYYLTRRPHHCQGQEKNLICVGGPEEELPDRSTYIQKAYCPENIKHEIDAFLQKNFRHHLGEKIEFDFCWHGLMGYTPNGVRLVGPEPFNKNVLYNLGCNGIGIMPSIYGAHRISRFIQGIDMKPSIFDPIDPQAREQERSTGQKVISVSP